MDDWKEGLSEEIRQDPSLKDVQSVEDLAKMHISAQGMLGRSIRPPGPDASDEDKAAFIEKLTTDFDGIMRVPVGDEVGDEIYSKIGKPSEAGNYKFPEIEDSPFTDEQVGVMKARAFENNLTQTQFTNLVNDQLKVIQDSEAASNADVEQNRAILQQEWGAAHDERINDITAFLENDKGAPEALLEAVREGYVDAGYAKWLHGLVERVSEPGELNRQERGEPTLTPAEARAQLNEVNNRVIGMPPTDPEFEHLSKKRLELAELAFGS